MDKSRSLSKGGGQQEAGGPLSRKRSRRRRGVGATNGDSLSGVTFQGDGPGEVDVVRVDPGGVCGGGGDESWARGGGRGGGEERRKRRGPRGSGSRPAGGPSKVRVVESATPPPQEDAQQGGAMEVDAPPRGSKGPTAAWCRTSSTTLSEVTETRFSSLAGTVSEATLRAVAEVMGYERMTRVQEMALPTCCSGVDAVAKAKTGTGKTIAFMIPALERARSSLARPPPPGGGGGSTQNKVGSLVLSPTRELAQQTAHEGRLLSRFYGSTFGLVCLVGGTPIKKDLAILKRGSSSSSPSGGCDVVVATPGRLLDHLDNTDGFQARLARIACLVFDEADQLLDMGFRPAIDKILAAIKDSNGSRQTLLFSATLPADVEAMARRALRPGYALIDAVGKEAASGGTHEDVAQSVVVCDSKRDHSIELVLRLAQAVEADPAGHKIIVFFTTARLTQFYAQLLQQAQQQQQQRKGAGTSPLVVLPPLTEILEIHSRKSQSQREKVSKQFREATGKVALFTSDVSARGMDYPDVTSVIQFGAPTDADQYVHRLGRTARGAGKRGEGCLLLADFEQYFLTDIKHLPVAKDDPILKAAADQATEQQQGTTRASAAASALDAAASRLPDELVGSAYQAWLGYHNSSLRKLRWSKPQLVDNANEWALQVAMRHDPPPLMAKTVGKMGLKGTPGLVIQKGPAGGPPGRGRG